MEYKTSQFDGLLKNKLLREWDKKLTEDDAIIE